MCSSWDVPCTLQTALEDSDPGDEIWVAAGTYKPTSGNDRSAAFRLGPGVSVYGGFPAAGGTWAQRNWQKNVTTLSGDIGIAGDPTDNSYQVLVNYWIDETAKWDGFTISNGQTGIDNISADVTLTNLVVSGNTSPDIGAGIINLTSNPTLINVTISGNSAELDGGGMHNEESHPLLTNVTFTNNTASGFGGGMYNWASNPTLTNVIFQNNSATQGGAIHNEISDPILSNISFTSNTAVAHGGAMFNLDSHPSLFDVTFTSNGASVEGGAMVNSNSDPTLSHVNFISNYASSGGAMVNTLTSSPSLTDVTFSLNSAIYGGAIFNYEMGNPIISHTTFSENLAFEVGGAMLNSGSNPSLVNVTVSGNIAQNIGGGIANFDNSHPNLTNVTLFGNSSTNFGGGILNELSNLTVTNSIIWDNNPDQISSDINSAVFITHSAIQGGFAGIGNTSANPRLAPLNDNGGTTKTHALLVGSSAIDRAVPSSCSAVDQRGFSRPVDGDGDELVICDMDAFESQFTNYRIMLPQILR